MRLASVWRQRELEESERESTGGNSTSLFLLSLLFECDIHISRVYPPVIHVLFWVYRYLFSLCHVLLRLSTHTHTYHV